MVFLSTICPFHVSSIPHIQMWVGSRRYIQHLTLANMEEYVFENQLKDAEASGNTRLPISGGTINRSTVALLPIVGARNEGLHFETDACPETHKVPNIVF